MRLTRFLMPTLRETPAEAQIVSHRLMLRAGMIRQSSAGIYSWLPLGYRAMMKADLVVLLGTDFPYSDFYPAKAKIAKVPKSRTWARSPLGTIWAPAHKPSATRSG